MSAPDEFYIGYETRMAPGVRRAVGRTLGVAIGVLLLAAAIGTLAQERLAVARFDYGHPQAFRGWLSLEPTPTLHVPTGNRMTRYWLVGRGKFGPASALAGHREGPVELDGTVITREHWQMLEIVPGSVRRAAGAVAQPVAGQATRTPVRLRGELVDSKCFLGVMNPGQGAAHRDCAVRCVSGGVPMMFAYRDAAGAAHLALLLESGGRWPDGTWRAATGTTVEISGELLVDGDLQILFAEER